MKSLLYSLFFSSAFSLAAQEIVTKEVSYQAGEVTAKGFLVMPKDAKKPVPGVLVVHEWWGMNGYAKKRAEMLARLGYAALALDMYGEGKTATHPKEAGAFASAVRSNLPEARRRFEAALKFLLEQPGVEQDRAAAIGYCFGGNVVLQMAIDRVQPLTAVASFHGSLGLDWGAERPITTGVLVCNGDADSFIPQADVTAFKEHMEKRAKDFTFIGYEGAKHAFTNPAADAAAKEFGINLAYHQEADEKSWSALQEFLKRELP